jgi:hypothetical protein
MRTSCALSAKTAVNTAGAGDVSSGVELLVTDGSTVTKRIWEDGKAVSEALNIISALLTTCVNCRFVRAPIEAPDAVATVTALLLFQLVEVKARLGGSKTSTEAFTDCEKKVTVTCDVGCAVKVTP